MAPAKTPKTATKKTPKTTPKTAPKAATTSSGAVTRRPGRTGPLLDNLQRWTELGLGLADFVLEYSHSTLEVAHGSSAPAAPHEDLHTADVLAVLPGAVAWLALTVQRRAFDLVSTVEHGAAQSLARVGAVQLTSPLASRLHSLLAEYDGKFRREQRVRTEVASTFLAAAGPETLDALLARVDLEAVLNRVDLDEVVARVDLDSVVARVDMDRVIAQVDMNSLMSDVVTDLEVGGLLRDGTGALANSTVGVLRSQVGGVASRIARRPQS